MFSLVKNNFLNGGFCHYEDDYGNKVIIRRTGDITFVAKLRFTDTRIKARPITIDVEKVMKQGALGDTLHLDYPNDADINSKSVNSAITAFTELLQYWIALFSDLRFSWSDNNMLLKHLKTDGEQCAGTWCTGISGETSEATEEDLYYYKYNLLKKYKELAPVLELLSK